MSRHVRLVVAVATAGFIAFSANAWMDEWAPAFKCSPAAVEELPDTNVSNFVSTVHSEDLDRADFYWQYCKGYKLDLNGDGIKDFVYILPWMGCGLAAQGYDAHFRVSAGANGWADTVIEGHDISKADLVNVAGNIYFRHSDIFWHFEKSKHNHWVYQIFSFGKNGDMICSNSEFGNLFPAVTIYYIKPKFKQIELTSNDLKGIEDWTRRKIHLPGRNTKKPKENFDLLNYRALWNDDAEKAKMVINPVSKKKEANDWKPPRKLTEAQCTKLMRIMTDRFGEPAKCRTGYASFVYVWRFEGDEWLSVGVSTMANMGGDPIAIHHWEWRKPELSVYDEEEAKARRFPIVQIDKEGLPPAAFFEFFNPYPSVKDGETEKNLITEFNVTKYLEESGYTRCTAEWDAVDRRYDIYTAHPDEWRCEFDTCKGGPNGGHTNEYHVGVVQFYKLASDLYMCYSMFCQDGTMGPDRVRYLFEVYDRDVWSVDSNKPIKSKLVRYIGVIPIDEVPKFRDEWIKEHEGVMSCHGRRTEGRASQPGPFAHERRSALATDAWCGMRVDWTVVADWPTGDSPVAKSVRAWIGDWLRYYRREPFKGDNADWDAVTRFYGEQFFDDNSSKHIENEWRCGDESRAGKRPDVDPGEDVFLEGAPRWSCRKTAIIQYEDERMVSYRAGFSGFFVGNVTSAAYLKCATFRKQDGKILGWDAFSDTNAVIGLVRKLTEFKYKELADYDGDGVIPVPAAPLFTKDGFWVFWGNYAVVHGHPYEMNGAFPSLFVPWRDPTCGGLFPDNREAVENGLTAEARHDLGLDNH